MHNLKVECSVFEKTLQALLHTSCYSMGIVATFSNFIIYSGSIFPTVSKLSLQYSLLQLQFAAVFLSKQRQRIMKDSLIPRNWCKLVEIFKQVRKLCDKGLFDFVFLLFLRSCATRTACQVSWL